MAAPPFVHRAEVIWPEHSEMFGSAAVPLSQSKGELEAFQDVTPIEIASTMKIQSFP